jgi:hypothetical protein
MFRCLFDGTSPWATLQFSVGDGNPRASNKRHTVRQLCISITPPRGDQSVTVNIYAPVHNQPEKS